MSPMSVTDNKWNLREGGKKGGREEMIEFMDCVSEMLALRRKTNETCYQGLEE